MKKILTNLAFIFVCCTMLMAQADFRKGYVVKLNGDTLTGFVNYQKEGINNSTCNFKRFEIAFPVSYPPEKLKAYGIDGGKQYLSAIINGKPVFIEYLVKGKISLMYLNRGGEHFYILSDNEKLVELKSGKTIDPNNNQCYDKYKDYLQQKLPGDYSTAIKDSKLEIKSLIPLIKLYNEQSKFEFLVPERPKEKNIIADYNLLGTNRFYVGILGGTAVNNFQPSVESGKDYFITQCSFDKNINPTGGIFLRWNISKMHPKWVFQTNILYQDVSIYGFSKRSHAYDKYLYYFDDVFLKFDELRLTGLFNYSFFPDKFKVAPSIGVGYCYRINPSYYRFFEELNTRTNVVKSYEYKDIKIKAGDIVAIGGITFEYQLSSARSILLSVDYQLSRGFFDTKGIKNIEDVRPRGTFSVISFTLGITL